ncbi:MAG: GEVED domain-containing protein [Sedimentisphaerales bacterium]|jgi:hypothetical protein
MKSVKLCILMVFAATLLGLMSLPAAAVSTSNHRDVSEGTVTTSDGTVTTSSDSNCVVSCPPGATMEQESCGEDKNGGCNMLVPAFEPIAIGETICGTAWADGEYRDTDWYQVTIAAPMKLIFTARAEFPVMIGFIDNHGIADCNSGPYFSVYATAAPCTDVNVSQDCQPGTYWLWVGSQDFDGYPCGSGQNNYVATLKTPYCDANSNICDEYIRNVQVGDINNSSGCNHYADYTALSTEMLTGDTYKITVTNGLSYTGDQCGIWIDWNQDGDFNDPGEAITVSGTPGLGPYTAEITPPLDAKLGYTRMRIRITYVGEVSPCGSPQYGEVEDYTILVEPNADLNRDGFVDFKDFAFFADQWLTSRP